MGKNRGGPFRVRARPDRALWGVEEGPSRLPVPGSPFRSLSGAGNKNAGTGPALWHCPGKDRAVSLGKEI